jgi:hypothetical protein
MEIQSTLIDYDKVFRAIEGLTDIEKDQAIKAGLRAATNVFLRAGRSNLRARLKGNKNTGNLNKSFRSKLKRNKLGAIGGFNQLGMHAHLLDMGTVNRTTRNGANRGRMIANNFWTDAINTNQNTAISKVYEGIERGIQRIIMRG